MRLIVLSLGFVILTACVAWLAYFNPGHTTLRLSPELFLDVPTVALVLMSMALGGLLAIVAAGFAEIKHLFRGWRQARTKQRDERIHELLQLAVNAKISKRFEDAVGLFQKILLLNPNHVPALLRLGNLYRAQGNATEAIRLHRKARNLEENNMEILLALAKDLEESKRLDESVQLLQEMRRQAGSGLTVFIRLRDLFVKLSRWEEAHDVQEKILQGSLRPEELKNEQLWFEGIKYEIGRQLLEKGERDRARRYFRGAIKLNRGFIPGYMGLGEILVDEGKLKDAGELWQKAYEMTSSILLLHRLEDLYLELDQPARVLNLYQEAVNREPDNLILRFYLGKLYYRLEMVDEAFEVLAALDPGHEKMPDLHKLLGNLYLRKGNVDAAVDEFKKALGLRKRVLVPYYCPLCDYHAHQWSGRCPRCGHWNSYEASPIMREWSPSRIIRKAEPV
ncbi:MAG TPA: tetratricopeptide repeat protein [Nitrospiria bacterium]|nr:tetratricopeptide repeat protein [Nitrospiria bacterium]